jgi:hypothetical protein
MAPLLVDHGGRSSRGGIHEQSGPSFRSSSVASCWWDIAMTGWWQPTATVEYEHG